MKKLIAIIVMCLGLGACVRTYNPDRTDAAGLMKNDAFMRTTHRDYVPNDKTIALISGISDSLLYAPYYAFENYENGANGLGYSKHYEYGGRMMATIFTYHAKIPQSDMPTDAGSPAFDKIYDREVKTIKSTEGVLYRGIKTVSDGDVSVRGLDKIVPFKKFAYTAYDMRADFDAISVMYLTPYRGAIFKVRINYPTDDKRGPEFEDRFMQELIANIADFDGDITGFEAYRDKMRDQAAAQ